MKVALIVNEIKASIEENMKDIISYINKAGNENVNLIVFPEAAITGLNLTDIPEEDIKLGLEMDSNEVKQICNAAKKSNLYVAIGILEKDENKLYDSLLIINNSGEIVLNYRRMSKGWRDAKQDAIYYEGTEIKHIDTEFGRISPLICGDLYDEKLIEEVAILKPDYFIFPFARSYDEGTDINEAWREEFQSEYIKQFMKIKTKVLAVNYVDNYCFGGAYVVNKNGEISASQEIGQAGMLITNI